jgi:hypothetical protein
MQIKSTLGGWQRLWVFISVLLFLAAIITAGRNWPMPREEILKGIDAPECEDLRRLPEGSFLDEVRNYGTVCDALSVLIHFSGHKIANRADYRQYVFDQRVRVVFSFALLWLLASAGLYAFGRAVGWVVSGFRHSES